MDRAEKIEISYIDHQVVAWLHQQHGDDYLACIQEECRQLLICRAGFGSGHG
jgi:hypothetical protein